MNRYVLLIAIILFSLNASFAQNYCISNVYIYGNKHTYPNVITKELNFKIGDILSKKKLLKRILQSEENLYNTSFFNSVEITYELDTLNFGSNTPLSKISNYGVNSSNDSTYNAESEPININININLTERWYYWPHIKIVFEDKSLNSWISRPDINRITLGLGVTTSNFLGLGHKFTLSGNFFYTKGVDFSYSNIALDNKRKHYIGFSAKYLKNKSIECYTDEDKLISIKDNDNFIKKTGNISFRYTYRPSIRQRHTLTGGFTHTYISDTVFNANPHYWGCEKNIMNFGSLSYSYEYDQRDYVVYPTKGYYINTGLNAEFALNSSLRYAQLTANYRHYFPLSKRWYYGHDLKIGTSVKNRDAYIYDRAIGIGNTIMQSYELFVIDGQHYFTCAAALKYLILPKKEFYINWLSRFNKFSNIHFTLYAKLLFEMGYADNNNPIFNNCYSNKFLLGTGLSLDLVTYYDIVLNLGYAINRTGYRTLIFGIKAPMF